MRNITFAIYKGIEYSAGIKKDGRIVLRSEDDASKKEGFVENKLSPLSRTFWISVVPIF